MADVDSQTAADAAAEELGAWLAGRTMDDRLGRDLRAVLNGYARMAAELEQVRKDYRRQLGSAIFWRRRAFQLAALIPAEQIPDPEWDDSDESQLAERNEELRAAVTEAAGLIDRLADDDACEIDHHGYCQTHNLHSAPCPHPLGRRFVEAWGAAQGNATAGMAASAAPDGAGDTQTAEQCADGLRGLTKLEGPQRGSQGVGLCNSRVHPDFADGHDIRCQLPAGHAAHRNGTQEWTP